MSGERILLLALVSSVGLLILLLTTNYIEAAIKDSPIEQVQCNPEEDDNCDEVQTASNDSSSTAKQATDSDQTRSSDSIKVEGQDEVQVDNNGTQEGKKVPPKLFCSVFW